MAVFRPGFERICVCIYIYNKVDYQFPRKMVWCCKWNDAGDDLHSRSGSSAPFSFGEGGTGLTHSVLSSTCLKGDYSR